MHVMNIEDIDYPSLAFGEVVFRGIRPTTITSGSPPLIRDVTYGKLKILL
jgi:hypothetical protein